MEAILKTRARAELWSTGSLRVVRVKPRLEVTRMQASLSLGWTCQVVPLHRCDDEITFMGGLSYQFIIGCFGSATVASSALGTFFSGYIMSCRPDHQNCTGVISKAAVNPGKPLTSWPQL